MNIPLIIRECDSDNEFCLFVETEYGDADSDISEIGLECERCGYEIDSNALTEMHAGIERQ